MQYLCKEQHACFIQVKVADVIRVLVAFSLLLAKQFTSVMTYLRFKVRRLLGRHIATG